MANLITIEDVRNTSGATTELIDDDTITDIITKSQAQAISTFKVFLEPTEFLDIRDGNGKNEIRIKRPYIWKLLELKTRINQGESNTIDIEDTIIEPISSLITVNNFTRYNHFFYRYKNSVRIKYLSAFMEKTINITETTSDVDVGDNVVIDVSSASLFSEDDWVVIEGLDGKFEAAKITATDTNEITVDNLVQSHEEGSLITGLQTHELLTQYILYDASTNVANYIVGNTSDLPTGYSIEGVQAQIGVAYTHWRESAERFGRKRDEFKSKVWTKLNPIG